MGAVYADGQMPKTRLYATVSFRWQDRYFVPTPLLGPPPKAQPVGTKPPANRNGRPKSKRGPVPADHPWRRCRVLVGTGRLRSPASHATPYSPNGKKAVDIS